MKIHLKEDHYISPPENTVGLSVCQNPDAFGLEFTSTINNIKVQIDEEPFENVSNVRIGFFNTCAEEVLAALTEFVKTRYINNSKRGN